MQDLGGLTVRAQTLWYATGIPKFVQETRESAVLRARMQALRERDQFGFNVNIAPSRKRRRRY